MTAMIAQEDLETLRESVAKVLAKECDSRAVHIYIDGQSELAGSLWARAAEQGWLAASLPEAWGGLGLGAQGLRVLHTEFGRRSAPGPFIATLSAAQFLAEAGPDEARERFLPAIAGGELSAAIPAAFNGAPLKLDGAKVSGEIDVLGDESAGLIIVPAGKGWALLAPGAGVSLERAMTWDRTRGICTLKCENAAAVAVSPDGGLLKALVAIALAADSLGGAENIYLQTVEYLKTRVQFDKPIASFQAIKHRVANMLIAVETQKRVLDHAVEAMTANAPGASMWASLAKAGASKAFAEISADCIQLHGGVGHTWEFDPHIFAKRARLNEALLADNRATLDVAAAELASAGKAGFVTTELASA